MPIQTIRVFDGRFQFDSKGIGMTVKQCALDANGQQLQSGRVTECVLRVEPPPLYFKAVDYANGEWGDFHLIPHLQGAAEAILQANGYTSDQLWLDDSEKVIPHSGFRIRKEVSNQTASIYHVRITKQPATVTIDGRTAHAGGGVPQSVDFRMSWDGARKFWKKCP